MKRSFLLFFFLVIIFQIKAQLLFEKAKLHGNINFGRGFYNTETIDHLNNDAKNTDNTSSIFFSSSIQYALTKHIGAGIYCIGHSIYTKKDPVTGTKPKTMILGLGGLLSYHPLVTKKFDLPLVFNFGFSTFQSSLENNLHSRYSGSGTDFGFGINPCYLLSSSSPGLMLNVWAGWNSYYYRKVGIKNDFGSTPNAFSHRLNGLNLSVGIAF